MKIAVCIYGQIPAFKNMIQNHLRYVIGPLQKFIRITLGDDISIEYSLCTSSMDKFSMIEEYRKLIPLDRLHFYGNSNVNLLQKACSIWRENGHSYRLIIMIRIDLFFTCALRESDMDRMIQHSQGEEMIYMGEDMGMGFIMGPPSTMIHMESIYEYVYGRTRLEKNWKRILQDCLEKEKLRCQWISIIAVRIQENGEVNPMDTKKCAYLEDLLMDDNITSYQKL